MLLSAFCLDVFYVLRGELKVLNCFVVEMCYSKKLVLHAPLQAMKKSCEYPLPYCIMSPPLFFSALAKHVRDFEMWSL